jgi:phosphohistidine phosphatase SixA
MHPRRLVPLLLVFCLAVAACGSGTTDVDDDQLLSGSALVEALADGGLVVYLRHPETTEGGVDAYETLGDCAAQRELSDAGRRDAAEIGAAFDTLGVPVGRVVASPFCRCVETAELAFDETETDEALLSLSTAEGDSAEAAERVRAAGDNLIGTVPVDGANTVLVGQLSNIEPITGVAIDEGATAIFRPDGDGSYGMVAQLPPQGWQALAAEAGGPGEEQ